MKVVVFAAAGKVGQEIVRASLSRGYDIVAVVRKGQELPIKDRRITLVAAELTELEALKSALRGADAVLTAFGPGPTTHDSALSDGLKNILAAMTYEGVKRIVLLSTNSVHDEDDRFDISWELIKLVIRTGAPGAVSEIVRMAEAVRATPCDYTLVRVPFLTEGEKTGKTRFGYLGKGAIGYQVTRADLAEFMVTQVANSTFIKKAVSVSN